ncbi:MAG: molybdenum cofactor guanylyltransferase [Kouleothrix sp.]
MAQYSSASAIVLAGGQSRRLGNDKRRLRLWGAAGPTLLEHTLALLAQLCDDLVVVLNDPEAWPGLPGRLVPDVFADGGALGGIYSGLAAVRHQHALAVACDMPFLSAELLGAMLAHPRDYDVLVPRSAEPGSTRNALGLETLHAIYGTGCLAPMRAALERGQRQIAAFFRRCAWPTSNPPCCSATTRPGDRLSTSTPLRRPPRRLPCLRRRPSRPIGAQRLAEWRGFGVRSMRATESRSAHQ